MTNEQRNFRDSQIVKARQEGLLVQQIATKHNLSVNQVWVILRKYKNQPK